MAKLTLDIEYDYDFILLGICCHDKDYKLCWNINNALEIELAKTKNLSIEIKKTTEAQEYAMFEFVDEDLYREWYLIANRGTLGFLIPEQKQADFFLMIKGTINSAEKQDIFTALKKITTVITAFEISPKTLKSKDNLLF